MKKKFIDYYMGIAELTAKLSHAKRLQVGAVIVKNNQIIGTGYNGMPAGWENDCEDKVWDPGAGGWLSPEEFAQQYPYECTQRNIRYGLKTKPEVLHAESNSILKVAKSTESSDGAEIFCTHAPCIECAKLIHQSGIKKMYYRDSYRDDSGITFLRKSGVEIEQYAGTQDKSNP